MQWLIYGANGYTARLLAEESVRRGLKPILAGRCREKIEPLARTLGLEHRVFDLSSSQRLHSELNGLKAVLHCAGPFSATAAPMLDACIARRAHYLDITGEIDVIEAAASRDAAARGAGVALLPAVGFDVVPTDCLAAMLASQLPNARLLQLAFTSSGSLSPGTTKTMVEAMPRGGRARIDGKITAVPVAWKTLDVPFRGRSRSAVTISWGDVASAWYSTGIPNIEVYAAASSKRIKSLRRWRWLLPLTAFGPIQWYLKRKVERTVHGPTAAELESARASIWGRVTDAAGKTLDATLETPGGYKLTVLAALACLERVLADQAPAGFSTPSRAFGKELILSLPGTDLRIGG